MFAVVTVIAAALVDQLRSRRSLLGFVPRAAEIGWRRTTDYAAFCESSTDLEMSAAS
jgi:hypothetical protein